MLFILYLTYKSTLYTHLLGNNVAFQLPPWKLFALSCTSIWIYYENMHKWIRIFCFNMAQVNDDSFITSLMALFKINTLLCLLNSLFSEFLNSSRRKLGFLLDWVEQLYASILQGGLLGLPLSALYLDSPVILTFWFKQHLELSFFCLLHCSFLILKYFTIRWNGSSVWYSTIPNSGF